MGRWLHKRKERKLRRACSVSGELASLRGWRGQCPVENELDKSEVGSDSTKPRKPQKLANHPQYTGDMRDAATAEDAEDAPVKLYVKPLALRSSQQDTGGRKMWSDTP